MYDSPSNRVRAGRVTSALQERVIGAGSAANQYQWFVFFLDSGHAVADSHGTEYDMSGPALRWGPLEEDTRLRVSAGSSGFYVFFKQSILDDAIGSVSEAPELRMFSAQHLVASFGRSDETAPRLENLFARIQVEANTPSFGSELSISAYLRLLLVFFRRSVDTDPNTSMAINSGTNDVARFRSLVEAHFRARWTARQYADAMGISYDRLHDLCIRSVGKPPAQLMRERCLHEARILLQRTALSSERIAAMLGFPSASQFNHFFKSMVGEPPGTYRRRLRQQKVEDRDAALRFADWP